MDFSMSNVTYWFSGAAKTGGKQCMKLKRYIDYLPWVYLRRARDLAYPAQVLSQQAYLLFYSNTVPTRVCVCTVRAACAHVMLGV